MAIYYYDFHEERGEFRGYVEDANGKDVWRATYPEFYEDEESGELIEGSTIFEDGYMKDATDIEGLEDYLKKIGILQHGDELEFMDDDYEDDDDDDDDDDDCEDKYAVGGSLESRVIKKIKDSKPFELPLEISVYVPSTQEASQIISKREYSQRIDEVQSFVAKLFGGFSSVSVEGGYVSDEKGLIQEDVTRVVAFASRVDFEDKLDTLLKQIVEWCGKWSQESIGFEFEGDLFYIDAKSEFEYGGQVVYKDGGMMAKGGNVRSLLSQFEKEKPTIALVVIADDVAGDFMRKKFDKTIVWEKLSDSEKKKYNEDYRENRADFIKYLIYEFVRLYYSDSKIKNKCKGSSRATINAIKSVMVSLAKEYPYDKYADGGDILMEDTVQRIDDPNFADISYYKRGGVLASSTTKEGITKMIGQYYMGSTISLHETNNPDVFEVHNLKGKIKGVKVIRSKGRFRFVNDDSMEVGGIVDHLKDEIEGILNKNIPNFYTFVKEYREPLSGDTAFAIIMAASDHEINRVRGQYPQAVSLYLNTKTLELHPQVFGGNGGQSIYRKPNMDDPREKYLAMKNEKVPFRTPPKNIESVLKAIDKFTINYKKTLIEHKDNLKYQDIVDYNKILK
jgi:hypothetical protein